MKEAFHRYVEVDVLRKVRVRESEHHRSQETGEKGGKEGVENKAKKEHPVDEL